eukprot:c8318_g1_i2.p1 GENE.c8318_g1_i2~~c8318_g1_i2.p1  ORF type:complete len:657 (+),score=169.45 c8318_g1_i2:130-2100(+)
MVSTTSSVSRLLIFSALLVFTPNPFHNSNNDINCCFVLGIDAKDEIVSYEVKGFNYEVARRVRDAVGVMLNNTLLVMDQLDVMFELDTIAIEEQDLVNKLMYSHIVSNPYLSGVVIFPVESNQIVAASGYTIFFERSNPTFVRLVPDISDCSVLSNETSIPVTYQVLDASTANTCVEEYDVSNIDGSAVSLQRLIGTSMSYFSDSRPIGWSVTQTTDPINTGISYSTYLTNSSNIPIAFASTFLFYFEVDKYLISNFGNQTDELTVIVVNNQSMIVGTSIPGVAMRLESSFFRAINLSDCENAVVKKAGMYVVGLPDSLIDDNYLFVHDNMYIQFAVLSLAAAHWHVIVVLPSSALNDFVKTSSSSFVATICIVCLDFALIVFFVGWVIRNRKLRLWRYSHPAWLLVMLFSNFVALGFAITLVISPSDSQCLAKRWFGVLSLGISLAAVLGKSVVTEHSATSPSTHFARKEILALTCTGATVLLLVLLLIVQSASDYPRTIAYYTTVSNELVLRQQCSFAHNGIRNTLCAILCLLAFATFVFAWTSRHASDSCEESRALVVIAGELLLGVIGYIFIELFQHSAPTASMALLEVVAVLWLVVTTQIVIFVPRLYRQISVGDLTVMELREMAKKQENDKSQQLPKKRSKSAQDMSGMM